MKFVNYVSALSLDNLAIQSGYFLDTTKQTPT
jgi:hypothetical protein